MFLITNTFVNCKLKNHQFQKLEKLNVSRSLFPLFSLLTWYREQLVVKRSLKVQCAYLNNYHKMSLVLMLKTTIMKLDSKAL